MGVSREIFYDETRIAIAPMGFCFPGHSADKGRFAAAPECRAAWHDELFRALPQIECVLAIGRYAQEYHFARLGRPLPKGVRLEAIVRRWPQFAGKNPKIMRAAASLVAQQRLAQDKTPGSRWKAVANVARRTWRRFDRMNDRDISVQTPFGRKALFKAAAIFRRRIEGQRC